MPPKLTSAGDKRAAEAQGGQENPKRITKPTNNMGTTFGEATQETQQALHDQLEKHAAEAEAVLTQLTAASAATSPATPITQYPHTFITLTTNTEWPELKEALPEGTSAFEDPITVCRAFKHRLDAFLYNLRNGKYFGGRKTEWITHVIEYQERGLPHAHIVCRLEKIYEWNSIIQELNPNEATPFKSKNKLADHDDDFGKLRDKLTSFPDCPSLHKKIQVNNIVHKEFITQVCQNAYHN